VLSQHSLGEAAGEAGISVPALFLEETGSTNSEARILAEREAPEWTIVATGHQTAGRGRHGRSWASAPGKALQFSLVLRPAVPAEDAPLAALLAAAEMAGACTEVAGVPVALKWPNDLLAGERKVGGVLPEGRVSGSALDYLILGIGVNVSMVETDFPEEIRASATSILLEGGSAEPTALLTRFLRRFREAWRPDAPDHRDDILRRYRAVSQTLGRRVRARTSDGRVVEGEAWELDERGSLRIGDATVGFGEVVYLD
jgi:BirA family transcriptional regulator, biotin operon repressor / biotin---[acetyl-CoA-carboxylase] ligase